MKRDLLYRIFGIALAITGIALAWIWFSWKLPLVVFLMIWANNANNIVNNPK